MKKLLDWWLRRVLRLRVAGLPDLPEIRRLMRLAWLNGFTFGAYERQVKAAHDDALRALAAYHAQLLNR